MIDKKGRGEERFVYHTGCCICFSVNRGPFCFRNMTSMDDDGNRSCLFYGLDSTIPYVDPLQYGKSLNGRDFLKKLIINLKSQRFPLSVNLIQKSMYVL